jgi:phenylacetate-CoA ligase
MATFIENLYNKSPIWLQNIFVSVKGWDYRYRRANNKIIREQFRFLQKSGNWSSEQYYYYQIQELKKLLSFSFQHVPFYRDMQKKIGCEPNDFKKPEDIQLLPILEKDVIRKNPEIFLNETINLKKCFRAYTGGSTGTPLLFYEMPKSFSLRWAFVVRLRYWAGLSNPFYPRRAQLTGRNIVPPNQDKRKKYYWRRNIPGNAMLFSTTHLSPETAQSYAQALCDFEPELIDGYPKALFIIARLAKGLSLKLPRPRAIIVSGETLLAEHRQEIEAAFQCKVFDQYAASEPSCFWCDCEHSHMHINPEYGISEIVDPQGAPVAPGEVGDVLVTSFLNPAMILIRYRIGDLAVPSNKATCACARQMPMIERIEGRIADDVIFVPERGYVGRMSPVFKGLSNIIETQIVQESLDNIKVIIVPDNGFKAEIAEHLIQNMRARLGQKVSITWETVDFIPRRPNGKFANVVSHVKHLYPDKI